jgi:hypothetical protein
MPFEVEDGDGGLFFQGRGKIASEPAELFRNSHLAPAEFSSRTRIHSHSHLASEFSCTGRRVKDLKAALDFQIWKQWKTFFHLSPFRLTTLNLIKISLLSYCLYLID